MTTYRGKDGHKFSYACGTDLTDFDNGQVKLAVGELNAIDDLISAEIEFTDPEEEEVPSTTDYPDTLAVGHRVGTFAATHRVQTGILTSQILGVCATVGAGDPYTHTITKSTTRIPQFLAYHLEKEGTSSSRRKDITGFVPTALDIYCSEKDKRALQILTGVFTFTIDADDVVAPTYHSIVTYKPYNWFNYRHDSGASAFTYNDGAINLLITEFHEHIAWSNYMLGAYDGNGYPTIGNWVPPLNPCYVELGGWVTDAAGTDIHALKDLAYASYAGDLVWIRDFYESANRYLKNTWSKMRLDKRSFKEVWRREGEWYDGVKFKLVFGESASTVATEEKNALSKVYYENN